MAYQDQKSLFHLAGSRSELENNIRGTIVGNKIGNYSQLLYLHYTQTSRNQCFYPDPHSFPPIDSIFCKNSITLSL